MVSTVQKLRLIRRAFYAGHFWCPEALDRGGAFCLDDAIGAGRHLQEAAFRSLSRSELVTYTQAVQIAHSREPDFDGVPGPAFAGLLNVPRCHCPDIPLPEPGMAISTGCNRLDMVYKRMQSDGARAIASGNWPGCHGIGDFHSAIVKVLTQGIPSFLRSLFDDILSDVQRQFDAVGLRFVFVTELGENILTGEHSDAAPNIDFSFVPSSDGWIGLAIVGRGETCQSRIWCQYLATYRGGATPGQIRTQWLTLIMHELGHNCGLRHTTGGIMNPSVINGLPGTWSGDPAEGTLREWYGGKPVPGDDGGGDEPDVAEQLEELRRRMDAMESRWVAQQGVNAYLINQLDE